MQSATHLLREIREEPHGLGMQETLRHQDADAVLEIRLAHRQEHLARDVRILPRTIVVRNEPLDAVIADHRGPLQLRMQHGRDRRLPRTHGTVDDDEVRSFSHMRK